MSMEHWRNNSEGETLVLGEEAVLVPLCPPQIPHGLALD